jgi:hypothetical protein
MLLLQNVFSWPTAGLANIPPGKHFPFWLCTVQAFALANQHPGEQQIRIVRCVRAGIEQNHAGGYSSPEEGLAISRDNLLSGV